MSAWFDSLDPEMRELVLGFDVEAKEHLAAFSEAVLVLHRAETVDRVERIASAFRAVHSIKGAAASLQLEAVAKVAHAMEALLSEVRRSSRLLAPQEQAALLDGADLLRATLDASLGGKPTPDPESLLARLRGEAVPAGPQAVVESDHADGTLRVDLGRLDALTAQSGELLAARAAALAFAQQAEEILEGLRGHRRSSQRELALRELERQLERLRAGLAVGALRLETISEQLLSAIQSIRLTSLGTIFALVRRVAHDAARRVGKTIELEIRGDRIELDKQILEAIKDPLIHLVRNAIDHGLEAPADRLAQGKPAAGRLTLTARQAGDRVEIELRDDGQGIDVEALKRAAVRMGLKTEAELLGLGPEAALDLMATPGLSTREVASELSGRGVGIDIVRRSIEGTAHGTLSLETERFKGTTFRMVIPISVATVTGLVFELEGQRLALLANTVERVVRLADVELLTVEGRPSLRHEGGQLVELLDLGARLELSPPRPRPVALLVHHGDRRGAFGVDAIVGEDQLVFKQLSAPMARVGPVIGGAVLEGDLPLVVLGAEELLRMAGGHGLPLRGEESHPTSRVEVLVVDDSVTTRTLETNILKKNGFSVRVATNGEEALREVRRARPDIVVSDVEMPVLDGLGLCRELRATPAFAGLPILLVTSLSTPAERAAGLAAGADDYLEKGAFDQERFLETLRRLTAAK
ncbi:MAG: hybrid sensor histidine kinase/response regulator [Deltaproteobacteria bacterium]